MHDNDPHERGESRPVSVSREWRLEAPTTTDEITRIHQELALRSMAAAFDWSLIEVEKPTETFIESKEFVEASQDIFGTAMYGEIAQEYLEWIKEAATCTISLVGREHYASFPHSQFHLQFPTYEQRLGADRLTLERDICRKVEEGVDKLKLPFRHDLHFYDRYRYGFNHPSHGSGYLIARAVAGDVTKERLAAYLSEPASELQRPIAEHEFKGTLGRMFDVLCSVAGVKTDIDPVTTEPGDTVPLSDLRRLMLENGVSPSVYRGLQDKIENGFRWQLLCSSPRLWSDVVVGGRFRIGYGTNGFRSATIEDVAVSTLAKIDQTYTRINPNLQQVLEVFKTQDSDSSGRHEH